MGASGPLKGDLFRHGESEIFLSGTVCRDKGLGSVWIMSGIQFASQIPQALLRKGGHSYQKN